MEFEEFNINGKLIPLGDLQGKLDDLDAWQDQEVIVHCKSGGRSAAAVDYMTRQGFKNARNLAGGYDGLAGPKRLINDWPKILLGFWNIGCRHCVFDAILLTAFDNRNTYLSESQ